MHIYCVYFLVGRKRYDCYMRFIKHIHCTYLLGRRKILRLYWADAIARGLTGRDWETASKKSRDAKSCVSQAGNTNKTSRFLCIYIVLIHSGDVSYMIITCGLLNTYFVLTFS